MEYNIYQPSKDLESFVNCYWTLEGLPTEAEGKQKILPDGCIDMAFILGDDIKRYVSQTEYLIQPRALVIGQITKPFSIEPCGYVNTFAVRFYPYGFCNFVSEPLSDLADKDTDLHLLFQKDEVTAVTQQINNAENTEERIRIIEIFLLRMLIQESTIDRITKNTVDLIVESKGMEQISLVVEGANNKIRQIERNFLKYIGVSPKKLGRAIRFQAALTMLREKKYDSLSSVTYENGYFDQAHFIHDFKHFTGSTPREFGIDQELLVSTLFNTKK